MTGEQRAGARPPGSRGWEDRGEGGAAARRVRVESPAITLGALLKLAGLADTGGQAKLLIQSGRVTVNGAREVRRGRKLVAGDTVAVDGRGAIQVQAERP